MSPWGLAARPRMMSLGVIMKKSVYERLRTAIGRELSSQAILDSRASSLWKSPEKALPSSRWCIDLFAKPTIRSSCPARNGEPLGVIFQEVPAQPKELATSCQSGRSAAALRSTMTREGTPWVLQNLVWETMKVVVS